MADSVENEIADASNRGNLGGNNFLGLYFACVAINK